MCGIFCVVGTKKALQMAVEGIKLLEYRGYDSAGVAILDGKELLVQKEVGKVSFLESNLNYDQQEATAVIAHTRWATHGAPSAFNAHPQTNNAQTIALVHNGIIENFQGIRAILKNEGIHFHSETDTEVIPNLISKYYRGDMLQAIKQACSLLEGSYAVALLHKEEPEVIYAFMEESPLVIGCTKDRVQFVSSDPNAFPEQCHEVIYLKKGQVARITPDSVKIYNSSLEEEKCIKEEFHHQSNDLSKGQFSHYTLKEIHEQPQSLRKILEGRFDWELGTAIFNELNDKGYNLRGISNILILACGTSWHAGYAAAYMFEDLSRIPVRLELSSEFRYKNPVVSPDTLVIAVSQSGETADTIAAVRELKGKGVRIFALCNVPRSTLTREADTTIYIKAGPEIGVCSTKAFTNQIALFALLALFFGRMRHMGKQDGQEFVQALNRLPEQIEHLLFHENEIQEMAKKYAKFENFFYIGRSYMYPTALEGALKLKEISYINANGYAAGEMKHGPIALISDLCPTVAFCANQRTFDKILSNLQEIRARSGRVIAIAEQEQFGLEDIVDDIIRVPQTMDPLSVILSSVAAQLFAFYVAKERGTNIDQPRNLAKSVTVE